MSDMYDNGSWTDFKPAVAENLRLLRCINMAMGCLNAVGEPDERLGWLRLLDAIEGREPRPALTSGPDPLSTEVMERARARLRDGPTITSLDHANDVALVHNLLAALGATPASPAEQSVRPRDDQKAIPLRPLADSPRAADTNALPDGKED